MNNQFRKTGFNRTNRELLTAMERYSLSSKFDGYKMSKLLYFAYGSNMLMERIQKRVGKVKHRGTYVLRGWRLSFNCGHWHCAFANIVPGSKKDYVEGVLYELDPDQIADLDRYEVVPHNYYKEYFVMENGSIGFAYVATEFFSFLKGQEEVPELDYLNILLDGCVENKLKTTFKELYEFKTNTYKLKNNRHFERFEDNF